MEFLNTRRDLINWFIKNEVQAHNHTFSGGSILKRYRELKDKLFCKQVFKDECYEKYWILGNIEGIVKSYVTLGRESDIPLDIQEYRKLFTEKKRFVEGEMALPTSVKAPANALSRLCGELANMYHEGLLHRFGRGSYCVLTAGMVATKSVSHPSDFQVASSAPKAKQQVLVDTDQLAALIEDAVSRRFACGGPR